MRLQPKRESFIAQKEFLHTTQGLIHKVGGLTLKASAFTPDETGHVKAGSPVTVGADGYAVPYDGVVTGTHFILAHDVHVKDGDAVGGALEEGYLKKSVVQAVETGRIAVTDGFITATGGRFKLR